MPSILSRFKRSSSTSSSHSVENRHTRSDTVSSSNSQTATTEDDIVLTPSRSSTAGQGGSSFVEQFDEPSSSPTKQAKHKPTPLPLGIPDSTNKQVLGTPKLVLTEEGSNSPRSFESSPVIPNPRAAQPAGLGIALGAGARLPGVRSDPFCSTS